MAAFVAGTFNYSITFWLFDWSIQAGQQCPWLFRLGMLLCLFLIPAALSIGMQALLRWERLRPWIQHPTPTGWDYFLGQGKECWMLFHLKDGSLAGGLYRKGSFASASPHNRDVYVRDAWRVGIDGKFMEQLAGTLGMWISVEECTLVELFEKGGAQG